MGGREVAKWAPGVLLLLSLVGYYRTAVAVSKDDLSPLQPKKEINSTGMTLSFVIDSTESMEDELNQVKEAMQEIFEYMKANQPEIANYALVEFNDPEAKLISLTNDSEIYKKMLENIEISGGDDCPEMAIKGIIIALEESLPNSHIFVFTDASAKDYKNESIVQDLIQLKKSRVVFVLTGKCEDDYSYYNETEKSEFTLGYEVYERIAHISNGYVFNLTKSEVHKVLEFVKLNVGRKNVICIGKVPTEEETDCITPVDETMKKLTVTVTGKDPRIIFKDPSGTEIVGNNTLQLETALSKTIDNPKSGNWTIKVKTESPGRFIVLADSSFSIIYGFSTKQTENLTETTARPLAGIKNILLIQIINNTNSIHLTQVIVKDETYNTLYKIALHSVANENGTYKTQMFLPPDTTFFLEVNGQDLKRNTVKRISETGIVPLFPEPPIIEPETDLIATLWSPFSLMCHVVSSVPFTASWYKGNEIISPEKQFMHTATVYYNIDNITMSSDGVYTCKVNNTAGNVSQSVELHVKVPPPSVKIPATIEVAINKSIEIPCKVQSDLNYTVLWTKKEKPGAIKHKRFFTDNLGTLKISTIERSDGGIYQCTAHSKSGNGTSDILVKVAEPVHVLVKVNKQFFRRNEQVQLTCAAIDSIQFKVSWKKNGVVIQESDPRIQRPEENKLFLNIARGQKSDEGVYTCEATNIVNTDRRSIEMKYLEAPEIKMNIPHTPALIANTYILHCNATGSPKPTISWSKDGHRIIPSRFQKVLSNGSLIIRELSLKHSGLYQCTAENQAGKTNFTRYIDVGSIPQFDRENEDIQIAINKNGSLPCHVSGHPTPKIRWSRSDGRNMSKRFSKGPSCSLHITGVHPEDEGTYIVTATNKFGVRTKEIKIHIFGVETPVLNMNTSEEVSILGKQKELTCLVLRGNPPPRVTWYKDNIKLKLKDLILLRGQILKNRSLVLQRIKPENEGSYECVVSNIAGNAKRVVNLKVYDIPRFIGLTHVVRKVKHGNSVTLDCKAHGKPNPEITWMKHNISSTRPLYSNFENDSLLIQSVTLENNGTYECIATNSVGIRKKTIELVVYYPPPVVETSETIELQADKPGKIPCHVDSELNYTVTWERWMESGSFIPLIDKRFTTDSMGTLKISSVKESDEGSYRCAAESRFGRSESEIDVEVKESLKVIVSSTKKKFRNHEHIQLSCFATGSLPIVLTWENNGTILQKSIIRNPEDNKLLLNINNGQLSDEGVYKCEGQNTFSTNEGTIALKYLDPPQVTIKKPLSPALIPNKYILQCFTTGSPKPSISWKRNGFSIISGSSETVLNNGTLIIHKLSFNHTGMYQCTAANEAGKMTAKENIHVGSIPEFDRGNKEIKIEVLKNGLLPCHANGYPVPITLWHRRDGRKISERFSKGPSCSLYLTGAHPEDEGIYIVTATNIFGNKSKEYNVYLTGIEKPVVDHRNSAEEAVVGESKELTCLVLKGNPPPTIKWYKDAEKLEIEDLSLLNGKVFTNGSLIFPYVRLDNGGSYECITSNIGGETRRRVNLKIQEPPHFTGEMHTVIKVTLTNYAKLPCYVFGYPMPTVMWMKNGRPLTLTPSIVQDTKSDSLIITTTMLQNNGTYECVAVNSAGKRSKIIELLVQYRPRISPQDNISQKIGQEIILKCEVDAYPTARIKWFKNGALLNKTLINQAENNSSVRLIAHISSSGHYKCVAMNEVGSDNIVVNVVVTEPPVFKTVEERIQFTKGENLTLSCETGGVPPPHYYWEKDAEELDFNESVISFNSVDNDFAGLYICTAINSVGNDTKVFVVTFYIAPNITTNIPKEQILKKGRHFTISCNAEGKPPPKIIWLKNGENFTSFQRERNDLIFKNVSQNDTGLYTCKAVNYEGTDERNMKIIVQEPPQLKETLISVQEVTEKSTAIIFCPVTGFPKPEVWWLKDRLPIHSTKRIRIRKRSLSLKIQEVQQTDTGVYICIASNGHDSVRADIPLHVLSAPRFINKLQQNITLIPGTQMELNCSNIGEPKAKVTWYKNNHQLIPSLIPHSNKHTSSYAFVIPHSKRNDEGTYKCIAENKAGSIEHTFHVQEIVYRSRYYTTQPGKWKEWSMWSECSATCGRSERIRVRVCEKDHTKCEGHSEEWQKCTNKPCEVDGDWGMWSIWSPCSVSCGSGVRFRKRRCDNPLPQNHGRNCTGSHKQNEACNTHPCPVDGSWSEWSSWQSCFTPCSKGTTKQTRECTNPIPAFGGKDCLGLKVKTKPCPQVNCPVHGGWSMWTDWSPCSSTCGHSTSYRRRLCNNPTPSLNGVFCYGNATEIEICKTKPCDDTPLFAKLQLFGSLNRNAINKTTISVDITDMFTRRIIETKPNYSFNIFQYNKALDGWYPYLSLVVAPVFWLTALQTDGAVNGNTLTKGVFKMETLIKFKEGQETIVNHVGHGVIDEKLQIDVDLQANVPLFHSYQSVKIGFYEESYIQTGPGELTVISRNILKAAGRSIPYSWNATIVYDRKLGTLPGLFHTLIVQNIKSTRIKHRGGGIIVKKSGTSCPNGFTLTHQGYCQDINECTNRTMNNCHYTQICINSIGSYECTCPTGYEQQKTGECSDVDECARDPHTCSHWCENEEGSFKCLCSPGMALLDSKTNCSDIGVYGVCMPQQIEINGICRDEDPCKPNLCMEDQICVSINGRVSCITVSCPADYERIKNAKATMYKSCIKSCNKSTCKGNATISEIITSIIVTSRGPIIHYKTITELPLFIEKRHRSNTYYRVLKNEKGKPFRVKILNDVGMVYSTVSLPTRQEYRITVIASTYNITETTILYSQTFNITIYVSDRWNVY